MFSKSGVHGTTAATAFRLPVKGMRRRLLNETERTRGSYKVVCNRVLCFVERRAAIALRKFLIGNQITTILIDEKSMISQQDMAWRWRRMCFIYMFL